MTVVAIHQPQYLPWVPYFDKADSADVLVHLDNVQFQRRGVQNRNAIKTQRGALTLTVPVHAARADVIRDVRIAEQGWRHSHARAIQSSYARASFADWFVTGLAPILDREWTFLVDLNLAITSWMLGCLGIGCRQVRASSLDVDGAKTDLLISICRALDASVYVSGQGAKAYLDEDEFERHGIELHYQTYRNQAYAQCHEEVGFVPDLSALDLILNTGPDARTIMTAGRGGTYGRKRSEPGDSPVPSLLGPARDRSGE